MVVAEGSWAVAYIVFVAFVSLEVPLPVAGVLCILITVSHLICAFLFGTEYFAYLRLAQLISNTVVWVVLALAGFWIHRRAEGGTRKVILI